MNIASSPQCLIAKVCVVVVVVVVVVASGVTELDRTGEWLMLLMLNKK